ncbi:short-chain dehydrogenase/reductase family 16C member 6-like, partial [Uloborus diversus]
EKVQNVATEITSKGGWAKWYRCDVTSEEDVNEKAKLVLQNVGDVYILLNNAGLMQNVPFLQLDSAKIRKTFEINIIAHIWTIRAFLPNMIKKNRGHVVAISSAAGLMGHVNQSDYSASKFAVVGLMEALSEEMRTEGHDIRFTTVCPLTVDTGMNQNPIAKYPILTPILSIQKAAEEILHAIRTEEFIAALPRRVYCFIIGSKLFPRKCFCEIMDFVDYCRMANVASENSKTNNDSTLK